MGGAQFCRIEIFLQPLVEANAPAGIIIDFDYRESWHYGLVHEFSHFIAAFWRVFQFHF